MIDDNIDSLKTGSNSSLTKNIKLCDLKQNLMIENTLTEYNIKPTFFRQGQISSIDHLITNCPLRILKTETHSIDRNNPTYDGHYNISDHGYISAVYSNKKMTHSPQYTIVRDLKLLTSFHLKMLFDYNKCIN